MLNGELRSQTDAIWNSFSSRGISPPLELMEKITYLMFSRRLDDPRAGRKQVPAPLQSP
jgi:type I restriction enzyme M protein